MVRMWAFVHIQQICLHLQCPWLAGVPNMLPTMAYTSSDISLYHYAWLCMSWAGMQLICCAFVNHCSWVGAEPGACACSQLHPLLLLRVTSSHASTCLKDSQQLQLDTPSLRYEHCEWLPMAHIRLGACRSFHVGAQWRWSRLGPHSDSSLYNFS
jgi:hypothetical protein